MILDYCILLRAINMSDDFHKVRVRRGSLYRTNYQAALIYRINLSVKDFRGNSFAYT